VPASINVGSRLRIFWKDDKKWYAGVVSATKLSVEQDTGRSVTEHEIRYEDGDVEWLYLPQEKYEILKLASNDATGRSTRSKRKRREDSRNLKKQRKTSTRVVNSDSEDEWCPSSEENDEEEYVPDAPVMDVTDDTREPSPPPTPVRRKKKPKRKTVTAMTTPSGGARRGGRSQSSTPSGITPTREGVRPIGQHEHNVDPKFSFLRPENIRDKKMRRPSDPLYDPRTLYVPPKFLKSQTPANQQWWELKSDLMDTILFFKVGKFYEIFHMDAETTVMETTATFMKGAKAHCGFPEAAYAKFSQMLVSKGYRVVRIEQTETPDGLKKANQIRKKRGQRTRKVVLREVCAVLTPGTQTNGVMDQRGGKMMYGKNAPKKDYDGISETDAPRYLLAIYERSDDAVVSVGFCLSNAATGEFSFGSLRDPAENRSQLQTLIETTHPCEVVHYARNVCAESIQLLKFGTREALFSVIRDDPATAAADAISTLKGAALLGDAIESWPVTMRELVKGKESGNDDDALLVLGAIGAAMKHLKRCRVAADLVTQRRFAWSPLHHRNVASSTVEKKASERCFAPTMALDGPAIRTLEVLRNEINGTLQGSLIAHVDLCVTAFGRSEMRRWLANPLTRAADINRRLDAVDALRAKADVVSEVRGQLRSMPNLVSLVSRIRAMAGAHRKLVSDNDKAFHHPDTRAVFFEAKTYAIRKVQAFCKLLSGLDLGAKIIDGLATSLRASGDDGTSERAEKISPLLDELLSVPCAEVRERVTFFRSSFDRKEAHSKGRIVPIRGVNKEYDDAVDGVNDAKRALDEERRDVRVRLKIAQEVKFFGNFKHRFQLEVPERTQVPDSWLLKSKKKGYRRYWSPEIIELSESLTKAEERLERTLQANMWELFHNFSEHVNLWERLVRSVQQLDCLLAISQLSLHSSGPVCRPKFVEPTDGASTPILRFRRGRHPCVAASLSDESDFIPNDLTLGGGDVPSVLLLTGPNMGGKSTLLRQACVMVIMAQIGSYVPAEECVMTPVDRIFTRLGASDRIMSGQSTFFVELSEASTILNSATRRSLVIIDELGRGTSTFDGAAIASAVLRSLATKIRCRALFATHYYNLVDRFDVHPDVTLGHMSSHVDTSGDLQRITFLYTLQDGASPKSYGINVAHLARIPETVIRSASKISHHFELSLLRRSVIAETKSLGRALANSASGTATSDRVVSAVDEADACLKNLWLRAKEVLSASEV